MLWCSSGLQARMVQSYERRAEELIAGRTLEQSGEHSIRTISFSSLKLLNRLSNYIKFTHTTAQ